MEFAYERPGPRFAPYVEAVIDFAGATPAHARERLLPGEAMQLIVDLSDRPKRLYQGAEGAGGTDYRQAWIAGMQKGPLIIEAQQQAALLILRFAPGGAYPVLGLSAEALKARVEPLGDVLGRAAASLRDRVLEAPDHRGRMRAVEAWLGERLAGAPPPHRAVTHLVSRLRQAPGLRLSALAEETGLSSRQITALFQQWVGIGPKRFARIERFGHVLRAAAAAEEPDWADLAAALGYADQPHLAHEFKALSGLTPSAYARRYRGLTDFLPIGQAGEDQ